MTEHLPASRRQLFIDPTYPPFLNDGLFNLSDPILNRDGQLIPCVRARESLESAGITVRTADYLARGEVSGTGRPEYISMGILGNFEAIAASGSTRMSAFIIMEPPVVMPALYEALPRLTHVFDRVYVHNTEGAGYSLANVDSTRLRKFYWPIPHADVLTRHWSNRKRAKRVVVINGSHNPRGRQGELYSQRLHAMGELARVDAVDLYGMGWDRWWTRSAAWWPYWKNFRAIRSIYKGPCASKFDVLQNYEFSLCLENMSMRGYMTEKMFDALYAGTIPLYWGPDDILEYVPADVFVDVKKYPSWSAMWKDVSSMPQHRLQAMRESGREFLRGPMAAPFVDSFRTIWEG